MATLSKGPILLGCPQASPRPAREPRSWLERGAEPGPPCLPGGTGAARSPTARPSSPAGSAPGHDAGGSGAGKDRVPSDHTRGKGIPLLLEVPARAPPRTHFVSPRRGACPDRFPSPAPPAPSCQQHRAPPRFPRGRGEGRPATHRGPEGRAAVEAGEERPACPQPCQARPRALGAPRGVPAREAQGAAEHSPVFSCCPGHACSRRGVRQDGP